MFLRKLFNANGKGRWLILELLIVFIGVYLAFLFQSYGESRREDRERARVIEALKTELEFYRVIMPGRASYSRKTFLEQRKVSQRGEYTDYSDWRFLEPQYNYQVVEYAINHQNANIVDFELYDRLQGLYTTIKRLEHAERLMMEMAQRYKSVPKEMPANDPLTIARHADNLANYDRFLIFLRDRAQDQMLVSRKATNCLELINEQLDPERKKKLEKELALGQLDKKDTWEEVLEQVQEIFPDFTESEIREIFNELNK